MASVSTVILPVAGSGTRMLPATKSVPKELLPVYDTPLIQFAIDEAIFAGASRIVLITSPDKSAIRDYFASTRQLEDTLRAAGKMGLLREVIRTNVPNGVEIVFVEQSSPLGLGHAVLSGRDHLLPGPVGVILPDDLILGAPCLSEMAKTFQADRMTSLVAAQQVAREAVSSYGIFDADDHDGSRLLPARGVVEKPALEDAPSTLAAVGRYILSAEVFDALESTQRGAGGEIQLSDAIAQAGGIFCWKFSGTRYDCGSKDGMLEASNVYSQIKRRQSTIRLAAE